MEYADRVLMAQRYIRLDATDLINATDALELDMEEKGKVLQLKLKD
jgi:hypothetical protein